MRNCSAWTACLLALGVVAGALRAADQPEVIVVLGDLTMQRSKSEGRGARQFCDEVKRALKELGISFTDSRDTAVEKGALAGHKIAIFPYSAYWSKEEAAEAVKFTQQGGKLLCFYTVPGNVRVALGIKMLKMRPGNHRGEFDTVRFNEHAPANFPQSFYQGSPNSQIVEALEGAKVVADWRDESGKATGVPAIVQSANGFYMGHVFKGGDFAGHKAYLLAAIGHYLPHVWETAVKPTLAMIEKVGRFDSLEALSAAFVDRGMERPGELEEAMAKRAEAKALFARKEYRDAMAAASEAKALATSAYARLFPSRKVELRACWLGFPGRLDFEQVMKTLAANGFNAVFPLMCSAGIAYYDSAVLPQAPDCGDKLAECVKWAKHYGIEVHVWRINWQLMGSAKATVDELKQQGRCIVEFAAAKAGRHEALSILCPTEPRNRKLELAAMVEVVTKYGVDGIHFDYMRYGGWDQCYCEGCHKRFEEWLGRKVEQWPDDCYGKGPLVEKYRDWRDQLITSSTKEISEAIHRVRPDARVSLAARTANWETSRRGHDAQHWEDWVAKGYLDFLCPMDYTGNLEQLRRWITYQANVVDGRMPLYAGLGTTYNQKLGNAAIASDEIMMTRELGADGYIIFCWNRHMEGFIPALRKGVNKVDAVVPHRGPWVQFAFPDGLAGAPTGTFKLGPAIEVKMNARAHSPLGRAVKRITGKVYRESPDGQVSPCLCEFETTNSVEKSVSVPLAAGAFRLKVVGSAASADGKTEAFVSRSRPFRVLSAEDMAEREALSKPPKFTGKGIKVGIWGEGYGAGGIMAALRAAKGVDPRYFQRVEPAVLAPCEVVVFPQARRTAGKLGKGEVDALRGFVRRGGGLLVTHDAVGDRGLPALFPSICAGGTGHVKRAECITADGAARIGVKAGVKFAHAYYDHVIVEPGASGWVAARDADGQAVVIAGQVGRGRYVANGMATGLAAGDKDAPPVGTEKALLVGIVRWLGR